MNTIFKELSFKIQMRTQVRTVLCGKKTNIFLQILAWRKIPEMNATKAAQLEAGKFSDQNRTRLTRINFHKEMLYRVTYPFHTNYLNKV